MAYAIGRNPWVLEPLRKAMEDLGLNVIEENVAGGTDGGMLNKLYRRLPCPNLGTGAEMLHCEMEHISVEDLVLLAEILVEACWNYALAA